MGSTPKDKFSLGVYPPEDSLETTRLIGWRCKCSNVFSLPVLISREALFLWIDLLFQRRAIKLSLLFIDKLFRINLEKPCWLLQWAFISIVFLYWLIELTEYAGFYSGGDTPDSISEFRS